nr:MAG TPA: hypothetical protein [Caudoviricetes sp.]
MSPFVTVCHRMSLNVTVFFGRDVTAAIFSAA